MADKVYSLYAICLDETSNLIMEDYWRTDTSYNPFLAFHPNVIQDLISYVCYKTRGSLKSSDLFLLLSSGRLTNFKLDDVKIESETAEDIFKALLPSSEKLKSIKIRDVFCIGGTWISSNFSISLRSAKALISLDTCINFRLCELSNCPNLQKLTLNFVIRERLSSFLYVCGEARFNHSLKVLKIFKIQSNPQLYIDIAEIIQYCVELVEIDYDIAQSLVYLHGNNRASKYKLRKAPLGGNSGPFAFRATEEAIQIASRTCPDLKVVEVSPADYSAIHALSNFRRITVLTLNEPRWPKDDYHLAIHPLLEVPHFGYNLKSLIIKYYSRINFASIGACCPNLEELRVEYFSEDNWSDFAPDSFQKLISLYVENINDEPCEADSLVGILSNASILEFLTIRNASMLTDSVLDKILKNSTVFSKVKTLNIEDCGFSVNGLQKLTGHLNSVKYVLFSSRTISAEDAKRIMKNLNITLFGWTNRV